MAIWTELKHTHQVIKAAEIWRNRCLLDNGSVFSDKKLWTMKNFNKLKTLVLDNPIVDNRNFYDKLQNQIGAAVPEVSQLAAETVWCLVLFVYEESIGTDKKRKRISEVWNFSGMTLPESKLLTDESLRGLANPGLNFSSGYWKEYSFLLEIMVAWKSISRSEQSRLMLDSPWKLCEWIAGIEGNDSRAFRHMFLYLCYPKYFERICSKKHKETIYSKFGDLLEDSDDANKVDSSLCNLDKSIFEIRQALQKEYATEKLDFYVKPLRARWIESSEKNDTKEESSAFEESTKNYWIEKTNVKDRPDRQEGAHRVGVALWSPHRATDGKDIYASMRSVTSGDVVLHLTDRIAFTGVSVIAKKVDESFTGIPGTEWEEQPSYRVELRDYQALNPPLQLEKLFKDEEFKNILLEIYEKRKQTLGKRNLFYNKNLRVNQGGYITGATAQLVELLGRAYFKHEDRHLPHIQISTEELVKELFLKTKEVKRMLAVWRSKKNLILQGPPGVGKTFAARRLAYALIGSMAPERLEFVQFHQSYSYEDFIQGYRPSKSEFILRNGKFVNFCRRAEADPNEIYVFIIDEINRGNLSKIFGELMILIEADKRGSDWQIPLAYSEIEDKFSVPENVYLLGLMNTADRSLAVVDYALRRRFVFHRLVPQFNSKKFHAHLCSIGISKNLTRLIQKRFIKLNQTIEKDQINLGRGFCIGHSVFCNKFDPFCNKFDPNYSENDWYKVIIETEVVPLLEEYWFDNPERVKSSREDLLRNI